MASTTTCTIAISNVPYQPLGAQARVETLAGRGRHTVDEDAIFRAIETMRSIADEATSASKIARRQRERRLRVIQGGRADAAPVSGAPKAERQTAEQPWERCYPSKSGHEQGVRAPSRQCSRYRRGERGGEGAAHSHRSLGELRAVRSWRLPAWKTY